VRPFLPKPPPPPTFNFPAPSSSRTGEIIPILCIRISQAPNWRIVLFIPSPSLAAFSPRWHFPYFFLPCHLTEFTAHLMTEIEVVRYSPPSTRYVPLLFYFSTPLLMFLFHPFLFFGLLRLGLTSPADIERDPWNLPSFFPPIR